MATAEAANASIRITAPEWRWVAVYALTVSLLFSAPYLVAIISQTQAWQFGGALLAAEDLNAYFAKMNQGAHGAWLFTSPYTSEPQRGTPLYLFYLLLGKLAGADFARRVLVYHLARVAFDCVPVRGLPLSGRVPAHRRRATAGAGAGHLWGRVGLAPGVLSCTGQRGHL